MLQTNISTFRKISIFVTRLTRILSNFIFFPFYVFCTNVWMHEYIYKCMNNVWIHGWMNVWMQISFIDPQFYIIKVLVIYKYFKVSAWSGFLVSLWIQKSEWFERMRKCRRIVTFKFSFTFNASLNYLWYMRGKKNGTKNLKNKRTLLFSFFDQNGYKKPDRIYKNNERRIKEVSRND